MKNSCILFLFTLIFFSCGKEDPNQIPNVYVKYNITVQEFEFSKNQYDILMVNNQGYAGLIIYKVGPNNYKAYDRCSAVEPQKKCILMSEDSFTVTDPCSGAKYLLMDGSPAKAPAVRSLKQYQVNVANNLIMITNPYGN